MTAAQRCSGSEETRCPLHPPDRRMYIRTQVLIALLIITFPPRKPAAFSTFPPRCVSQGARNTSWQMHARGASVGRFEHGPMHEEPMHEEP
jgi:hypothetical protein